MPSTTAQDKTIGQQYEEKFGWTEDMNQAWRVAANRGVPEQFWEAVEQAVAENKPADPIAFVHRFHPKKD